MIEGRWVLLRILKTVAALWTAPNGGRGNVAPALRVMRGNPNAAKLSPAAAARDLGQLVSFGDRVPLSARCSAIRYHSTSTARH